MGSSQSGVRRSLSNGRNQTMGGAWGTSERSYGGVARLGRGQGLVRDGTKVDGVGLLVD